ncbi:MAG: DUF1329 domain-containing protein, partial [Nevskia sp.]|nr:DUF1329 domain-containing protein [Nevskia sp.]
MNSKHWMAWAAATACLALSAAAQAAATAAEAARLGKDLTPIGATAAGNSDGTVPAWIGGKNFDDTIKNQTPESLEAVRQQFEQVRAKSPADFDALLKYVDSFSIEQYPQISKQIDAIIAKLPKDQADLATRERQQIGGGGQYEKPQFIITKDNMAKYADHLTAGQKAMFAKYPDYKMIVYPSMRTAYFPDAINQATIKNATSANLKGTDDVEGAVLGFPFPIPKSGAEVIWNHKMRYRGSAVRRYNN